MEKIVYAFPFSTFALVFCPVSQQYEIGTARQYVQYVTRLRSCFHNHKLKYSFLRERDEREKGHDYRIPSSGGLKVAAALEYNDWTT